MKNPSTRVPGITALSCFPMAGATRKKIPPISGTSMTARWPSWLLLLSSAFLLCFATLPVLAANPPQAEEIVGTWIGEVKFSKEAFLDDGTSYPLTMVINANGTLKVIGLQGATTAAAVSYVNYVNTEARNAFSDKGTKREIPTKTPVQPDKTPAPDVVFRYSNGILNVDNQVIYSKDEKGVKPTSLVGHLSQVGTEYVAEVKGDFYTWRVSKPATSSPVSIAPPPLPDTVSASKPALSNWLEAALPGLGRVGLIPGPKSTLEAIVGVLAPGLIAVFGGLLGGLFSNPPPVSVLQPVAPVENGKPTDDNAAKSPPWQAPYGDGSAVNPYSDQAPAVFDHSPTPPDASQAVHVTADLVGVQTSTASVAADTMEIVAHGVPVNTDDKLVRIDPIPEKNPPPGVRPNADDTAMIGEQGTPVNSDDKLVTVDLSIKSATDPKAQLHELTKAALDAAITLEGKGKYVANYDLFDKVRYGMPHLVTSAVDWFSDLLPDVEVLAPQTDPTDPYVGFIPEWKIVNARAPHVTDTNWGQCGEFEQWGKEQLKDPIKKIFGEDAILTHIEIQSTNNPLANHIANEVILKNGDRYVVDMWETMATGEVKIYPESAWIEKWRGPGYVGSYSDVSLGGESSLEADLTKKIREAGQEEGIKKFLSQYPGHDKAKAEMIVNSYKANPWQLESSAKADSPRYRFLG